MWNTFSLKFFPFLWLWSSSETLILHLDYFDSLPDCLPVPKPSLPIDTVHWHHQKIILQWSQACWKIYEWLPRILQRDAGIFSHATLPPYPPLTRLQSQQKVQSLELTLYSHLFAPTYKSISSKILNISQDTSSKNFPQLPPHSEITFHMPPAPVMLCCGYYLRTHLTCLRTVLGAFIFPAFGTQ